MNRHHLLGLALLLVFVVPVAFTEAYAMGNDEWSDMDIQFISTNDDLTITCTKDIDVSFDMLMTVINYNTNEQLAVVNTSIKVLTTTITIDNSMIQVFCEYTNDTGDKTGYAVMRTFVP